MLGRGVCFFYPGGNRELLKALEQGNEVVRCMPQEDYCSSCVEEGSKLGRDKKQGDQLGVYYYTPGEK